jgi:membrane carboxypeptidase/penicillin-binding protein
LLSIDNSDGAVITMVGGRNFSHSAFNRTLQMKRPLGTAFTPFVYATLFSDKTKGFWPGSKIEDTPLDARRVMIGTFEGILGEWGAEKESNWEGEITMRKALALGKNGATVRAGEFVGLRCCHQNSA